MRQRVLISLALLLLLLCSCAAGSGNSATPGHPTPTATALTISSVPTSAVSTTPSPTKAGATPAATRSDVPLSQAGKPPAPMPFRVTSIDMSVTPASLSTWTCGSFIQVVYMATFHVVSGPAGGVIDFSYTENNGRSQTPERLTILPGQHLSNYVFTWQGALPADHTYPAPGGVMVSSPNAITSQMVVPKGICR